jgi:hypothetical protein
VKHGMIAGALACVAILAACDDARDYLSRVPAGPPSADEITPYYDGHGGLLGVEMSGNVVELRVRQPYDQLHRGGSLWARVGPFVYLFTPATRQVFRDFPGVAAVRVVTVVADGSEVARAMLRRDALNDVRWRRSLNILGHALQEGHDNPRRLEELTDWGERYADFSYNPDFVSR